MTMLLSEKCEVGSVIKQQREEPQSRTQDQAEEEQQPFLEETHEENEPPARPSQVKKPEKKTSWIQLSTKSRHTLLRLCGLFFFDSLARYVNNIPTPSRDR